MWFAGDLATFLVLLLNYETFAKIWMNNSLSPWTWTCKDGSCMKLRNHQKSKTALSLQACKMFCNQYGLLWPMPTGIANHGYFLSKLNIDMVKLHIAKPGTTDVLIKAAEKRFRNLMMISVPDDVTLLATGKSLDIYLVNNHPNVQEFSLTMDETYSLIVHPHPTSNKKINATIYANSFFGIRHGLETLSQVIFYDNIRDHLLIVRDMIVTDKPSYPYRGLLLDTARSYLSVHSIKSTIDAMAAVKLNTFHWHITDSQSFPFVSERRPQLSQLGAYSSSKVYTMKAIQDIVQFGLVRGVRVVPEFDGPAHVGEGWQDTNLTVCFHATPWSDYCREPPCGQLNPVKEELYEYLEDIYKDMAVAFRTTDLFHMGGDEVSEKCWNSSSEIRDFILNYTWPDNYIPNISDRKSFMKLWDYFQKKAQEKVFLAFGKRLPIILWTSSLTHYQDIDKYLDNKEYIIQVWTTGRNPEIKGILQKGYRLILSNYDAFYFDCGFSTWIGPPGNNWCSPYIGWQTVYDYDLVLVSGKEHQDQILGAEATLWTEQADSASLDGRLWPRAAALAEKLWSNPETKHDQAVQRMLHIRERLVDMGIQAEVLQPEFCYQNEGSCNL